MSRAQDIYNPTETVAMQMHAGPLRQELSAPALER